jgi:hypothetical protein
MGDTDDVDVPAGQPPALPIELPSDERYFTLFVTAIRKCLTYKPKFGKSRGSGLAVQEFRVLYEADPLYHWLGLDSPLMYAAHKAAGGMTSVYRQIGIGCQWIFYQILQDYLGLSPEQATWSYTIQNTSGTSRKLSLDGRIDVAHVAESDARSRIRAWIDSAANQIGLPDETLANIKGVVFETRQGYKSKDSKRQNADIANASKAYAHLYIPVIVLFSTQIDSDVAHRYQENLWLLLTGSVHGSTTTSTYAFCRDIVGYDLADFFTRHSSKIKSEIENVLKALLSA